MALARPALGRTLVRLRRSRQGAVTIAGEHARLGPQESLRTTWRLGTTERVKFTAVIANGVVVIRATAVGAEIIGLSIMSSQKPLDGSDAFLPLTNPAPKRTDSSGSISARWNAQTVTGPAVGGAATLTLLASVCLGPAVADLGNYEILQFPWNGKAVASLPPTPHAITQADAQRLQTTACRIAPDYPKATP